MNIMVTGESQIRMIKVIGVGKKVCQRMLKNGDDKIFKIIFLKIIKNNLLSN